MIDAQVINSLLTADLVIADLSTQNPNAFYEIGIRHMAQKPIIHMQLADETIPFDVSLYRAIKYSRARPRDLRSARDQLKAQVEAVTHANYQVENPVTRTRGAIQLVQHATPAQDVILEQMRGLQAQINDLRASAEISRDMSLRALGSPPIDHTSWLPRPSNEKRSGLILDLDPPLRKIVVAYDPGMINGTTLARQIREIDHQLVIEIPKRKNQVIIINPPSDMENFSSQILALPGVTSWRESLV
jgi:hypothetical protein